MTAAEDQRGKKDESALGLASLEEALMSETAQARPAGPGMLNGTGNRCSSGGKPGDPELSQG